MSDATAVVTSESEYSWTEVLEHPAGFGAAGAVLCFYVTKRPGLCKTLDIRIVCRFQPSEDAESREIAKLEAYLVGGYQPGINFHYYMSTVDKETDECKDLATTLFQENGKMHGRWVSDPLCNGAGRWSFKDLEQGIFIVIHCFEVKAEYRSKVVGKALVEGLIAWGHHNKARAVFVRPEGRAIAFWRFLGFRRIGTSDYFCYSSDAGSATWPAAEDWNPPGFGLEGNESVSEAEESIAHEV